MAAWRYEIHLRDVKYLARGQDVQTERQIFSVRSEAFYHMTTNFLSSLLFSIRGCRLCCPFRAPFEKPVMFLGK